YRSPATRATPSFLPAISSSLDPGLRSPTQENGPPSQRRKHGFIGRLPTSRGIDVLDVNALEREFGSDPGTTRFAALWNWVLDLSYSPDGKRIAVRQRYDEGFPKVLSIDEDRVDYLPGHPAPILDCSYSEDGRSLVSASGFDLRVWDGWKLSEGVFSTLLSGEVQDEDVEEDDWDDLYEGHADVVLTCAISPDADRVVSGSKDGTLIIWKVDTAEVEWVLTGHDAPVTSCGYSPDGDSIVSGDEDGTIRLWDAESGDEWGVREGHSGAVTASAYSRDGELLATGSEDGTLVVWDAGSEEERAVLSSPNGPVRGCAFSPEGDLFFSLSDDGTLTTWDGATFERVKELRGPVDSVTCCSFSHDCRWVVSAAGETPTVWDTTEGTVLARCTDHTGLVRCCAFSPDGEQVISGGDDRTLRAWSASTGSGKTLGGHAMALGACAYSPAGNLIVTGSHDGGIGIWNADTGGMVRRVDSHHGGSILTCAVSPDGACIASGGFDESAHLYDARTGELQGILGLDDDVVLCLFSPFGERLLCVADGEAGRHEVTLWDLGDEEGIYTLNADKGPLLRVSGERPCAFSPDGRRFAVCPERGTLNILEVETGEVQRTLEVPGLQDCVFMEDPRFLLTTSGDNLVEVWETETGQKVAAFPTDDKPTALAHSRAAKEIAIGGFDGGFYRLRVHLGEPGIRSIAPLGRIARDSSPGARKPRSPGAARTAEDLSGQDD
ncbi:MAG: WD40 repeat domain-containing protein, partial [Gemmatimonadota bacterium]